jgi:hypothetical protein
VDPGDFAIEGVAQVLGCFIDRHFLDGSPEFQLISFAVAFVTVISTRSQVNGKRFALGRVGPVDGTGTMALVTGSIDGFESQPLEDFFHRDLFAKQVKVDSRHGIENPSVDRVSGDEESRSRKLASPFRF